jgi:hypothetical protein
MNQIAELATKLLVQTQNLQAPEADGSHAIEFLYTLARLEAHKPEELKAAGVDNLVEHARMLRQSDERLTPGASDSLMPEVLVDSANDIAHGQGDQEQWADDVLMLATVSPWLTPEMQKRIAGTVQYCSQFMARNPRMFRKARSIVLDRVVSERTAGLVDVMVVAASQQSTAWVH